MSEGLPREARQHSPPKFSGAHRTLSCFNAGRNTIGRSLFAGGAITFLASGAYTQTEGTYLSHEATSVVPFDTEVPISLTRGGESANAGGVATAYGYDFGNGFKTEIGGVTLRSNEPHEGSAPASVSLTESRVTLSGLYEFRDSTWHLKPYVGAGFAMVDVRERLLGARDNDWVSAYQLRGGVSLGFTQRLLGSLEYHWIKGSKPRLLLAGIPTKIEIDRHGFVVGINYKY